MWKKRRNNESKLEFNFYHCKHVRFCLLSVEFCYVQKLGVQLSASPSEHSYGLEELTPKNSSFFSIQFQWRFHILSFCNPWPQAANLSLKLAHSFPCHTPCLHIFLAEIPGTGNTLPNPSSERGHISVSKEEHFHRGEYYIWGTSSSQKHRCLHIISCSNKSFQLKPPTFKYPCK